MMINLATYQCNNCPKNVWWDTSAYDWRHTSGEEFCDSSKRTAAAPKEFVRCMASQPVSDYKDGRAHCGRPSDGHAYHVATSIHYSVGVRTRFKDLETPLYWTEKVQNKNNEVE